MRRYAARLVVAALSRRVSTHRYQYISASRMRMPPTFLAHPAHPIHPFHPHQKNSRKNKRLFHNIHLTRKKKVV
ncbi:MAG: hypothetical protein LBG77_02100 [Dysgonamonadaceae bacterium]|nr:hypothetical protein [Dysgonamonadaceae bacterium]